MINTKNNSTPIKVLLVLVALFIAFLAALLAYRAVSGSSLGLRSFARDQVNFMVSRVKAAADSGSVKASSNGDYTNIIFLHHSVGHNLINQGQLRELFTQAGYNFYDHDYNYLGIRNPHGDYLGYGYNVPGDNTDPDGLARIFAQPLYPLPLNTFSGLLQHEVIVFKSCFPNSDITSEDELEEYKTYYLDIRSSIDQHPDKLFILVTSPPLNPAHTDLETASRAGRLADWLVTDDFLAGRANLFTFNFFDYLAEDDPASPNLNMLRAEYREGDDSHPNPEANQKIGPIFVDFVLQAINTYH